MLGFITSLFEVSLGCSIVIVGLLLLSPMIRKHYGAKWTYWIWLLLALRLLLPFDTPILEGYDIELPKITMMGNSQAQQVSTFNASQSGMPFQMVDSHIQKTTVKHQTLYTKAKEPITVKEVLLYVWVGGMLLYMLYYLMAYRYMRHQVLRWSRSITNDCMLEEIDKVTTQMHITKHIPCYICEKVWTPMMLGFIKPVLLFPKGDYNKTQLHYILKHEYMHYKRHDVWYKLLLLMVNGLHWFNPLVYIMRQHATKDIELCCDDDVVKGCTFEQRIQYGKTILASISEQQKYPMALCTYFNQGKKMVKDRLGGIINMKKRRNGMVLFGAFGICTLVISGLLTFDHVTAKQMDIDIMPEEKPVVTATDDTTIEDSHGEVDPVDMDRLTNAVLSNDIRYVKDVIEEGNLDLNIQDSKGRYPLAVTLIMTNCDMAKLLLHAGADPFVTTSHGETIYDQAMTTDSKYFIEIFKQYGIHAKSEEAKDNGGGQHYFTTTPKEAVEFYIKALLESNYEAIYAISYGSEYHTDGQEIYDTIQIKSVKLLHGETKGNKAYYALELDITDGGNSAFETGIFPRWLYLNKNEQGWYAEGLMTSGAPDDTWWDSQE